MAGLDRDALIRELEQLGDADDATVLAAARSIAALVAAADADWDGLLAPHGDASPVEQPTTTVDEPADEPADETADEPAEPPAAAPEVVADGDDFAAEVAIIDKLLARPELFEGTRQELEASREDIAAGEFLAADRKYLHALNARLSKSAK